MATATVVITQEHIDVSSHCADISPIERAIEDSWDDVKEAWIDEEYTKLSVEFEDGHTEVYEFSEEMDTYIGEWLVNDNCKPRDMVITLDKKEEASKKSNYKPEYTMDFCQKMKDSAEMLHDHYRDNLAPDGVSDVTLLESFQVIINEWDERYEEASKVYFKH